MVNRFDSILTRVDIFPHFIRAFYGIVRFYSKPELHDVLDALIRICGGRKYFLVLLCERHGVVAQQRDVA